MDSMIGGQFNLNDWNNFSLDEEDILNFDNNEIIGTDVDEMSNMIFNTNNVDGSSNDDIIFREGGKDMNNTNNLLGFEDLNYLPFENFQQQMPLNDNNSGFLMEGAENMSEEVFDFFDGQQQEQEQEKQQESKKEEEKMMNDFSKNENMNLMNLNIHSQHSPIESAEIEKTIINSRSIGSILNSNIVQKENKSSNSTISRKRNINTITSAASTTKTAKKRGRGRGRGRKATGTRVNSQVKKESSLKEGGRKNNTSQLSTIESEEDIAKRSVTVTRTQLLNMKEDDFDNYIAEIESHRNLTTKEITEVNRQKKLIKNREAARYSRKKKREHVEEMEEKRRQWKEKNNMLKQNYTRLETENRQMKDEITYLQTLIQHNPTLNNIYQKAKTIKKQYQHNTSNANWKTLTIVLMVILFTFQMFFTAQAETGNFESIQTVKNQFPPQLMDIYQSAIRNNLINPEFYSDYDQFRNLLLQNGIEGFTNSNNNNNNNQEDIIMNDAEEINSRSFIKTEKSSEDPFYSLNEHADRNTDTLIRPYGFSNNNNNDNFHIKSEDTAFKNLHNDEYVHPRTLHNFNNDNNNNNNNEETYPFSTITNYDQINNPHPENASLLYNFFIPQNLMNINQKNNFISQSVNAF